MRTVLVDGYIIVVSSLFINFILTHAFVSMKHALYTLKPCLYEIIGAIDRRMDRSCS